MKQTVEIQRFKNLVNHLRRGFPNLHMEVDYEHQAVDATLYIPEQPSLTFTVNIHLQNLDELHLSTEGFWLEWFPCGDQKVYADFLDAVSGLLNGSYRIVEHLRGGRVRKAELQRPLGAKWKNIATYRSGFHWFSDEKKVVQNLEIMR